MAEATSSLPVPDSPQISAVVALAATWWMRVNTRRMSEESPRMFSGRKRGLSSVRRRWFSCSRLSRQTRASRRLQMSLAMRQATISSTRATSLSMMGAPLR